METSALRQFQRVWTENGALVQLLGLCPLLAITSTLVNGFILGCATLFVLLLTEILISCTRHWIPQTMRLPIFVLVIGGLVGTIDLLMETYFYQAYKVLGLFVPLIITNCVILAHAETFASKNPPLPAAVDALITGGGFWVTLVLLGGMREWLGHGTLFRDFETLLNLPVPTLPLNPLGDGGFIPILMPAGAFFVCGFLVFLNKLTTPKT